MNNDCTDRAASAFRFVDELPTEELATLWIWLRLDDLSVLDNDRNKKP